MKTDDDVSVDWSEWSKKLRNFDQIIGVGAGKAAETFRRDDVTTVPSNVSSANEGKTANRKFDVVENVDSVVVDETVFCHVVLKNSRPLRIPGDKL